MRGEVDEIFAQIRHTFGLDFVPNLFKAMAHDPVYLKASWSRVQSALEPGVIERKTKEMIAILVLVTDNIDYRTKDHTATWKAMGCSDLELAELKTVVDLFSEFNQYLAELPPTPAAVLDLQLAQPARI